MKTTPSRVQVLQILFLTLVTGLIYARCISHDFLVNWDDYTYVVDNPAIRGFSPENLKAMFTRYYVSNYAPLQILSYALDHQLWGFWFGGYALTNVLLHLANGLLLYLLVWKLSGSREGGAIAAALFLFHPLQVESVAWISQRKNVLAMFFFLSALLSYLSYKQGAEQKRTFSLILSVTAFAAATMSKSVAIILPAVLVLLDTVLPGNNRKVTLADKLPYLIIAILCGVMALESQSAENLSGGRRDHLAGSPLATFFTMLPVFARYLALILWPEGLSAVYSPQLREHVDLQVFLAGLLLLLVLVSVALLFRRNRQLFFWLSLFLVGFIPVSQIIPLITLMNDRYCYFPLLGVAGGCGTLCAGIFTRCDQSGKKWIAAGCALLLLIPAFASWQRAAVWKDAVTLWTATYRAGDHAYGYDSHFVETALAEAHIKRAQREEQQGYLRRATTDFLAAVAAAPDDYNALNGAGAHFTRNDKLLMGQRYFLRLTKLYPRSAEAWHNLGFNLLLSREYGRSAAAARTALAIKPESGTPRLLLGHLAMATGRGDEARKEYLAAENAGIKDPDMAYNLACLDARADRRQEALARLKQALAWGYGNLELMRSDPDLANVRALPEFNSLLAGRQ